MKKLLSTSIVLILSAACLTGCEQEPNVSEPEMRPMAAKINPPPANPALTWLGAVVKRVKNQDVYYSAIYVGDSDITNRVAVQIAALDRSIIYYNGVPGWSPSGGSICFTQKGMGTVPDTIKAFDVSVNASGDPVGSNRRTIIGMPNQNSRIRNAYWSSTATMGKIAYSTIDGTTESLWFVSQSGGTATNLWTVDNLTLESPTWNSDDSRLAVVRNNSAGGSATIMIFNTSTGAYVDSISINGTIKGLEWSRSGMNKLAFSVTASGSDKLYYCDPTTGATPATNNVTGAYPTWSPNNSSTMYVSSSGLNKNVPFTTSTTSVSIFGGVCVKWKR